MNGMLVHCRVTPSGKFCTLAGTATHLEEINGSNQDLHCFSDSLLMRLSSCFSDSLLMRLSSVRGNCVLFFALSSP